MVPVNSGSYDFDFRERFFLNSDDDKEWSFDNFGQGEEALAEGEELVVSLDGFEGPLDLLLALARRHKVDMAKISMAELAGQYIAYIEDLKSQRLEIAADYLVMAAWLTFIKSKLMMPSDEGDELMPSGEALARQLQFRLRRLDAMRESAKLMMARDQLGQAFFACGQPEGFTTLYKHTYLAEPVDLFRAYAQRRSAGISQHFTVKKRAVWSIKKARGKLASLLGISIEWAPIDQLITKFLGAEPPSKTAIASTFGASLEMARDGVAVLKQSKHFGPIYIKPIEGALDDSDNNE